MDNKDVWSKIIFFDSEELLRAIRWAIDNNRKFEVGPWTDVYENSLQSRDGWRFQVNSQLERADDFDSFMEMIKTYEPKN